MSKIRLIFLVLQIQFAEKVKYKIILWQRENIRGLIVRPTQEHQIMLLFNIFEILNKVPISLHLCYYLFPIFSSLKSYVLP